MRAPQFFRTGTGHREGRRPLAAPFTLQISFMQEIPFRRLIRSLSLRPYCLLAPRADQAAAALGPPGFPRLLLPGFQVTGSPHAPAGYSYGAKLRIAPAGLAPASTAASLAAPSPQDSHPLHSHQLAWRTSISPPPANNPYGTRRRRRAGPTGRTRWPARTAGCSTRPSSWPMIMRNSRLPTAKQPGGGSSRSAETPQRPRTPAGYGSRAGHRP